jgi:uncharacterized protein YdeI (YjbR/CyaY-like superfamily)
MPELHPKDNRAILSFKTPELFEKWMKKNCQACEGIWIKFAKKGSGVPSIVYAQALDVALCYGWIDSQAASLDEKFYLQRFTPRGKRSKWSKINRNKVARLIAAGRMTPRGQAAIEAAKADGRWARAYASSSSIRMTPDFKKRLAANPKARRSSLR